MRRDQVPEELVQVWVGSASAVELVAWKVRGLFGVRVAALLLPPASDAVDCHGRNAPIHARRSKNARYQVSSWKRSGGRGAGAACGSTRH